MTFAIKDRETGKLIPVLITSKKDINETKKLDTSKELLKDPSFFGCFTFELIKPKAEFNKLRISIFGNKQKAFLEAKEWINSEDKLKGYKIKLVEVTK